MIAIFILAGMNLNAQRGYGQRGLNAGMNLNTQGAYYGQRGLNSNQRAYYGQRGLYSNQRAYYGLNLSDKQLEQVEDMRIDHLKEVQPLRDQLMEIRVHQRTLMNALNPDKKAINENIDKASKLQNEIAKLGADFQLKFISILSDEQKVMVQSRRNRFGNSGYGRGGYGMQRSGFQNYRGQMQRGTRGYGNGWNSPWFNTDIQDKE